MDHFALPVHAAVLPLASAELASSEEGQDREGKVVSHQSLNCNTSSAATQGTA
jgi:endo-beta-N-acetylglucosaminidase D